MRRAARPAAASDTIEARIKRLEAVLFLAREPINSRRLSDLAGLEDGTQARTLVARLNERYDLAGRAFSVKRVAGGYQMLTRPQFSPWLRRLGMPNREAKLSTPAMETLAVVAYRQPVLKSEIESIRGVGCGEVLRQLMDTGLVKIAGRSPRLGHPYLYATTKKFLELFGLPSLDALPRADKLREQGLPDWTAGREQNQPPAEAMQSDACHPDVSIEESTK